MPAINFGAAHGINTFSDYDAIIVIGTYMPNQKTLEKEFNIYFRGEEFPTKFIPKIENNTAFYEDSRLQKIYHEQFEQNEYDSINRIRPLNNPDKEIHIFGYISSTFLKEGDQILKG